MVISLQMEVTMSDGIKISQDHLIITPKTAPSYLIPCRDWEWVKSKINTIPANNFWTRSIGFSVLGAGASFLGSIFLNGTANTTAYAWVLSISAMLVGAVIIGFSFLLKGDVTNTVESVIKDMQHIESKYPKTPR